MRVWQLQEAKAKFTELTYKAQQEPQIISRRGAPVSVMMSIEKYEELSGKKEDLLSFFQKSPLYGVDLELDRDRSSMREFDL
jgi:prevent-host-death family protein